MSHQRQDLALGLWAALAAAMLAGVSRTPLLSQEQEANKPTEQPEQAAQAGPETADEEMPPLQIDPNASPEEVQAQIEAQMKARREAIRRQLARDPAWKPAFVESHVIRVGGESEPVRVHNFCLDLRGNLLVCCGGDRLDLIEEDGELQARIASEAAEIRVLSSDGKRVAAWPLEFTPQAVAVHRDGTVFVGGGGRIARLDPRGRVIAMVNRPDLPEEEPEAEPPAQEEIREGGHSAEKVASSETAEDKPEQEPAEPAEPRSEKEEPSEEGGLLAVLGAVVSTLFGDQQAEEEAEPGMSEAAQEAMRRYLARQAREVSGIAATDQDLFVACPTGTGYAVWRMGHAFSQPEKIVDRLRGCCGQMDIQAADGKLYVAENARMQVVAYDRDGNQLGAWGKGDRTGVVGFGSCCNPMNIRFGPGGEVYTSEASVGRVKRFSPEGEFLGLVGNVTIVPGCKHVPIGISADGDRVYLLDITGTHIVVLQRRRASEGAVPETDKTAAVSSRLE